MSVHLIFSCIFFSLGICFPLKNCMSQYLRDNTPFTLHHHQRYCEPLFAASVGLLQQLEYLGVAIQETELPGENLKHGM